MQPQNGLVIEGYASVFGARDLNDDVVVAGAFQRPLLEWEKRRADAMRREIARNNAVRETTLKRIEEHRLRALVLEDLRRYPGSAVSDIHGRIGVEIPRRRLQAALVGLVAEQVVCVEGKLRWTRYSLQHGTV